MIGQYFCILFYAYQVDKKAVLADISGIWTEAPTAARNEICVCEKKLMRKI